MKTNPEDLFRATSEMFRRSYRLAMSKSERDVRHQIEILRKRLAERERKRCARMDDPNDTNWRRYSNLITDEVLSAKEAVKRMMEAFVEVREFIELQERRLAEREECMDMLRDIAGIREKEEDDEP